MDRFRKNKTKRVIHESTLQCQQEYLWKILGVIVNRDIYTELFTKETDDEQYEYLKSLECLFIQRGRGYSIPKHIILHSKQFTTLQLLTNRHDLVPGKIKLQITQLSTCCSRKRKHARLIY